MTATSSDALKLNVFDKTCLINGGGISGCLMWEKDAYGKGTSLPSSLTYANGGTSAKSLVSGNTYITTVLSYDTTGNVIDFASSEFLVP